MSPATPEAFLAATAQAFKDAYDSGYRHGRRGGSRSKDPFLNSDGDLHLCWDTGWVAGAEERDRKKAT